MAQRVEPWKVRGDTTGAPPGCSASAGIAAINLLIAAMRHADSTGLDRALAPGFVFSITPLVPTHRFFVARAMPDLLRYAEERRQVHDRMEIEAVIFNGWRRRNLQFGPIYFLRTADDLGGAPRRGGGKGAYSCGNGILAFNLGRLPDNDPGPDLISRPPRSRH